MHLVLCFFRYAFLDLEFFFILFLDVHPMLRFLDLAFFLSLDVHLVLHFLDHAFF